MNEYVLMLYMFISTPEHTLSILRPFFICFTRLFSYHTFTILQKDKIILLRKHLHDCKCTNYDEDSKPCGYILSGDNSFMCYIPDCVYEKIYIVCKKEKLKEIFVQDKPKQKIEQIVASVKKEPSDTLDYYYRSGDYSYFKYTKRKIYIRDKTFTTQQQMVYDNIIKIYNEKNNVNCYLYGDIHCGKTFLCYLMARELKCYFCDSFNPCEPSDSFSNMYHSIDPTPQKPLILLLDEVDIMVKKVHEETIIPHKNQPIEVYNKTTWNNMLDKIDYGLYPNLILILCSNLSYQDINNIDTSYLRKGRIDLVQRLIN